MSGNGFDIKHVYVRRGLLLEEHQGTCQSDRESSSIKSVTDVREGRYKVPL